MPTKEPSPAVVQIVAEILQGYADRGIFRGFSQSRSRGGKAVFKVMWHRDRLFELVLDTAKKTIQIPLVLPEVTAGSSMYEEFQEFIRSRHSTELPVHRRIEREKAEIECGSRAGHISLTLTVNDGDYDYGTRRLVNTVHETYLVFLSDGRYYDYMLEKFDLDPDRP